MVNIIEKLTMIREFLEESNETKLTKNEMVEMLSEITTELEENY